MAFMLSSDAMPSLKPSLPYGQLPVLEYQGATLCQSITVARFLAMECGLAGRDSLENAKIDEVVDAVTDFQTSLVSGKQHSF